MHDIYHLVARPTKPHHAVLDACPVANEYGDTCGRPATPLVTSFAICPDHARELYIEVNKYLDGTSGRPAFITHMSIALTEQKRERERHRPAPTYEREGFVYYVQVGPHIKIGHTIDLEQRMRAYPPSRRLLAVEPGGRREESARLREFRHLLDAGQEWHRPGTDLVEHINRIREASGASPIPIAA